MSVFCFIDNVSEVKKNESLTAFFTLKGSEEFLMDHFPGFPVMPGVLLLESLKQAASRLLEKPETSGRALYRFLDISEVKFGQLVKPKSRLKISVKLLSSTPNMFSFDGRVDLMNQELASGRVVSASFSLAPTGITKV